MNRMFDTHKIREEVSLDGVWDFRMDGADKVYAMPVPGCWEQHPDFARHRGVGVYTRSFYLRRNGNIRLVFKGVTHTGDVFFDGEHVAHHYNAYTPFCTIIKNVKAGEHTLAVQADNRFSEASALHVANDYFTYGGINRPVSYEYIGDAYIKYMHFTPAFVDGVWQGKAVVSVVSIADEEKTVTLTLSLAGVTHTATLTLAPNGEAIATFEGVYPEAVAWEPEAPKLYYAEARIEGDGILDDLIDRVGFRVVEIIDKRYHINGKKVFFKGLNRHEDYPIVGCAVPVQLMSHDLDLFRDMGANAIRTSHYPNDERFLDMCDERGFMVWEENHARGLSLEQMQNPNFERQCKDCIDEMIEAHFNHPSIVIWGILNECASDTPEGKEMYARQYAQIKALDPSRPTTSASCKFFRDLCFGLPDSVSVNCYFNPLNHERFTYEPNHDVAELIADIDSHEESAGKAFIASEFGEEAIYGFRELDGRAWSEENQRNMLVDHVRAMMNNDRVSGLFIWMFADTRIDEERFCGYRPHCRNNKGVVDAYRRPKLSYDAVKQLFLNHKVK